MGVVLSSLGQAVAVALVPMRLLLGPLVIAGQLLGFVIQLSGRGSRAGDEDARNSAEVAPESCEPVAWPGYRASCRQLAPVAVSLRAGRHDAHESRRAHEQAKGGACGRCCTSPLLSERVGARGSRSSARSAARAHCYCSSSLPLAGSAAAAQTCVRGRSFGDAGASAARTRSQQQFATVSQSRFRRADDGALDINNRVYPIAYDCSRQKFAACAISSLERMCLDSLQRQPLVECITRRRRQQQQQQCEPVSARVLLGNRQRQPAAALQVYRVTGVIESDAADSSYSSRCEDDADEEYDAELTSDTDREIAPKRTSGTVHSKRARSIKHRVSRQTQSDSCARRPEELHQTFKPLPIGDITTGNSNSNENQDLFLLEKSDFDTSLELSTTRSQQTNRAKTTNKQLTATSYIYTTNSSEKTQNTKSQQASDELTQQAPCGWPSEKKSLVEQQHELKDTMTNLMSSQMPTTVATAATAAATATMSKHQLTKSQIKRQLKRQQANQISNYDGEPITPGGSPHQLRRQSNISVDKQVFNLIFDRHAVVPRRSSSQELYGSPSDAYSTNKPNTTRIFYHQNNPRANNSGRNKTKKSAQSRRSQSSACSTTTMTTSQPRLAQTGSASDRAAALSSKKMFAGRPSKLESCTSSPSSPSSLASLSPPLPSDSGRSHQRYEQSSTRFTFDRNLIRAREHRSLSTSSSMTTDSSESSAATGHSASSGTSSCSPASSGYSSSRTSGGGGGGGDQPRSSGRRPAPASCRQKVAASPSNPIRSTPSEVDEQPALHPAVSALLLSTASLSLAGKQQASPVLSPVPSKKRIKKIQQASEHAAPSSTPETHSPSGGTARNSYIQDATYLERSPSLSSCSAAELSPPPSLAAAPPRPWLRPEEQLNYLSKGQLRQRARQLRLEHATPRATTSEQQQQQQRGQSRAPLRQLSAGLSSGPADLLHRDTASEFTVLSYNVLSDRMVNTERFPGSPDLALNWLYRRELILRQLLEHKADVIALQELEWEQYETYFKPKLESVVSQSSPSLSSDDHHADSSYCGLFEPKSRARTMDPQMRKRVDGCAIFYKRNKFKLVARHLLEFNQIAMANARGSEAMLNRVMTKDNIGLAAVLELLPGHSGSASRASSTSHGRRQRHDSTSQSDQDDDDEEQQQQRARRLVVCNTHIHWNPDCCDVKLVQAIMLMNELKHIARHYSVDDDEARRQSDDDLNNNSALHPGDGGSNDTPVLLPLILMGDFNSLPKSGVLDFLLDAKIDSSHKDFKDIRYTECSNALALRETMFPARVPTDNKCDTQQQPSEIFFYEHPFKLASAYERGVMPFTNFTTKFKATIDYIFFDQQQIELTGLLGPLDKLWLKENKIKGFPQLQFPSDHLPLLARFCLRTSRVARVHQVGCDHISGNSQVRQVEYQLQSDVHRPSQRQVETCPCAAVLSNKFCHKVKF